MTSNVARTGTVTQGVERVGAGLRQFLPKARLFLVDAVGQGRILRKAYPGVMHALIFWGVTIQILGTAINLMQMQLFVPFVELPFPRGAAYLGFELLMDLAGVAILVGVLMAAFRRGVLRPQTLRTAWDDVYALALLALIPLVGFTTEGLRLLAADPEWAAWSPIGSAVAGLFQALGMTPDTAATLHGYSFWAHAGLGLLFIASIPFTKLRHLVLAPLNIISRPQRKEGVLSFIDDIDEAELLGVGQINEFAPEQLLAMEACVRCGRCEERCPAAISGMPFSPCSLVGTLRETMHDTLVVGKGNGSAPQELIGGVLAAEAPWSCTTCGACLMGCPTFVNPVDDIVDLRRYQVLMTGQAPKAVGDVLRNLEQQGNPWAMPGMQRTAWAKGLRVRELAPGDEVDVLLFLGCAFAFDDRNQKVARSFVQLLQRADVDFGILGLDEGCCGETARRLGHEYLFQVFAEQNIEAFQQINFKRIVTQCPHCFNTLKNEYPQLGGDFEVMHYSELLAELEPVLAPQLGQANGAFGQVTYHDPCYLGRYNGNYDTPRQLLDRVTTERVEMGRRRQDSFCCGGGGGQMWLETEAETRINLRRLDEAQAVKAETVATACPYCLIMFDDAIRSRGVGNEVQVKDIAELWAEQLQELPEPNGEKVYKEK